jgi:tRNA(fMet)-specific endonuclease VapC
VLLDTNAYSGMMRGDESVVHHVVRAQQILLSSIVAGELLFGFRQGTRLKKNLAELEAFLENPNVSLLPVTMTTADRFGRIAVALRAKGKPIPTNDIWIAAHAFEAGADLLSFDKHFAHIDGLAWLDLSDERRGRALVS